MFKNLVASEGKRRRTWTPTTATASVLLHALLIGGAVYASVAAPKALKEEEELVEFMEIPEEVAPEPEPEPEPPAPEPETPPPAEPPPPKGFQELIPPSEPPPAIPEVDLSQPAVSVDDFTGIGQAGGTSTGVEGGTPQAVVEPVDSSNFAYEVAVLEKKPELRNGSQIQSLLQRLYPRMLQDAGIGGTTVMQFVIEADGTVDPTSAKVISTSHEQFGEASIKIVERFRFTPGRYKGKPVRVLTQMPITWRPQG